MFRHKNQWDAQPTSLEQVAVCWPREAHKEEQAWGGKSELAVLAGTSGREVLRAVGELSLGREMIRGRQQVG